MFKRILVPIDGSSTSNRGLEQAIALAKDQSARLCLLHVVDELPLNPGLEGTIYLPPTYVESVMKALRDKGQKLLAKAETRARQRRLRVETVLQKIRGRPVAEVIIHQANKWRADVIVLGTHGRRGLSRLLMGSDAEMVVREAPVPVLLVHSPGRSRNRASRRR
jgi:nucleotide-binding universal stress UspA family protein